MLIARAVKSFFEKKALVIGRGFFAIINISKAIATGAIDQTQVNFVSNSQKPIPNTCWTHVKARKVKINLNARLSFLLGIGRYTDNVKRMRGSEISLKGVSKAKIDNTRAKSATLE